MKQMDHKDVQTEQNLHARRMMKLKVIKLHTEVLKTICS